MAIKAEEDFLPESVVLTPRAVARIAYFLSIIVLSFVAIFLVWANKAVLDEVTRGDASVIPSGHNQVVQNLEGGILAELLVHDGELVNRNDVLLRIANTTAASNLQEMRAQYYALMGQIARLSAEANGKDVVFPDELRQEAPQVANNEDSLHRARMLQLETQSAVIQDQVTQREGEISELRGRLQALTRNLELAKEERAITIPLVPVGAAARVDLVRLERQVADLEGQVNSVRLSIPRAEAALTEAKRRVDEKDATFRSDALGELNQRRNQFAAMAERIQAERDRVTRTEVRSPVRGTIKEVKVNTVGGVIRPGQDLIEIVPLEETLLIEARIRPADIAFLRPGQQAMVKITAYDFSIYGGLRASLEQISADAIKDERGDKSETFFRIRLRTDKNSLGTDEHPLPIIPGMTATVDILTGQKTVLDYLLKPIFKARDRALRER
jgi:adhesin transport system membrane fusion protein